MLAENRAEIDTAAGQRVQMCCWPPSRCCFQFGIVLFLQQPNGTLQRHSIAGLSDSCVPLPSAVWSLHLHSLCGHSHRVSHTDTFYRMLLGVNSLELVAVLLSNCVVSGRLFPLILQMARDICVTLVNTVSPSHTQH